MMTFMRARACLLQALIGALAFPGGLFAGESAPHVRSAGTQTFFEDAGEGRTGSARSALPSGVRVLRDVAYGPRVRQRMDVYLPSRSLGRAPVVLMVHGGAWRFGDKDARGVVDHKLTRWAKRGFILISTNYTLLPEANPAEQAQEVAQALALAQRRAAEWGGNPEKFILMGHSAGAHLVALLTASPAMAETQGAHPWLGTVSLDTAAFDVPGIMAGRHLPLYDRAFGQDPAFWRRTSPLHQLSAAAYPLLAVCSTQRANSCPQAHELINRMTSLGVKAAVLEQNLSHLEINQDLGLGGPYTEAVETFMGSLDPAIQQVLTSHPGS
jgi:acetyl esterase/lipase